MRTWHIGCHALPPSELTLLRFYVVNIMEVHPDFRDLLALLNKHGVEYVIVGGYALAFHGAPRFTGDVDVFVRPTPENAKRIVDALSDFGFPRAGLDQEDFAAPNKVIQLGVPPVRVDLITSISGVTWSETQAHREPGYFGDVPVYYIGRTDFIINKRTAARQKDLADLEALDER